jgi:peroxiredoxin Q/BCP
MTAAVVKERIIELTVGDKAPLFDVAWDSIEPVTEETLRGKHMVIYFYPKDDTPGCTQEAKDFKEHMKDFKQMNTVIIGVSKDSVDSHNKFRKKYCLPFPLASDESGKMCEDYGVWVEKSMYGKTYMGIERATFVIDKTGVIRNIWRKVKVDGHVKDVLEAIKQVQ